MVYQQHPQNMGEHPCVGTCPHELVAAGVEASCQTEKRYLDLSSSENANATLLIINYTRFDDASGIPILSVMSLFSSAVGPACNATIQIDTCNFTTARVTYDVVWHNETMTLDLTRGPRMVEPMPSVGDSSSNRDNMPAGPLAGLGWLLEYYFVSNAHSCPRSQRFQLLLQSLLAGQYTLTSTPKTSKTLGHARSSGVDPSTTWSKAFTGLCSAWQCMPRYVRASASRDISLKDQE